MEIYKNKVSPAGGYGVSSGNSKQQLIGVIIQSPQGAKTGHDLLKLCKIQVFQFNTLTWKESQLKIVRSVSIQHLNLK